MTRLIQKLALPAILLGVAASPAMADMKLGLSIANTGPYATISKRIVLAAEIAIEEINAAGGVNGQKLVYESFDTGGKPEQAVAAARHFAEDTQALAIVGPYSTSECRVAFPAGERGGISQMSMASSAPKVAAPFTYAFRNTSDEGYMLTRLLRTVKNKGYAGATASIAFANDDAVSRSVGTDVLPALFKEAGIALKDSVSFRYEAFDLSPQVSQMVQNPTDLIGVGTPPDTMLKLAAELRRQGHKGRMIAGSTVADWELPGRMGAAGVGSLVTTTFYPALDDPRTKAFGEKFKAKMKGVGEPALEPNQFDAATYDIVYIYAEAMKRAKVTGAKDKLAGERTAIRDEVRKTKDFPALTGAISIGADGDALKPIYIVEAEEKSWKLLEVHKD